MPKSNLQKKRKRLFKLWLQRFRVHNFWDALAGKTQNRRLVTFFSIHQKIKDLKVKTKPTPSDICL